MNPLKITVILLTFCLASCQREEPDRIVTQSMAFGIKPNQGPLKDTTRYMICGTGAARILGLDFDPAFSVFWESFYKDLVKRNYSPLIKKTRFPLHRNTGAGQASIVSYEKKNFKQVFSKFLSAGIEGQTRFERLTQQSSLRYVQECEDSVIIEGLVFEKIKGDWFLSALDDKNSK